MNDLESVRPENNTKAGGKKGKGKSVAAMIKKKKVAQGSDDDEDDEFSVASKASRSAPKVSKPPALPKKKLVKTENDVSTISALKPSAKTSKKDVFDFDSKSSLAPKRAKKIIESDDDLTSEGSALDGEIVELTPKPPTKSKKVIEIVSSESDFDMDAPVISKKAAESKNSSAASSKRSSPVAPATSNKKIILGTKKAVVAVVEKKLVSKAKKANPISDDDTVTDVTSHSRTARAKAPKKIIISDGSDENDSAEASFSDEVSSEQFSSDYD
jgi:hypothetical protein